MLKKTGIKKIRIEKMREMLDSIRSGYDFLDDMSSSGIEFNRSNIEMTRYARRNLSFVIRGSNTIIDIVLEIKPDTYVSNNKIIQKFADDLFENKMSKSFWKFSGWVKCIEAYLTDGYFCAKIYKSIDIYGIQKIFCTNLDILDVMYTSRVYFPSNKEFTLMWPVKVGDKTVYYQDVDFYPSEESKKNVMEMILKNNNQAEFDWNTRVFVKEFNGGVPIAYPAVRYAECLDRIIELQSAVLEAIALASQSYAVDDAESVSQAKIGFDQLSSDNENEKNFRSSVVIGNGKLSSVNLLVAMLSETAVLYLLTKESVYNTFPGLRPQAWAEDEKGGLSASDRNQLLTLSANRVRSEIDDFFQSLLEYCIIVGDGVEGTVLIDKKFYDTEIGLIESRSIKYKRPSDKITLKSKKFSGDLNRYVDAFVDLITAKGREVKFASDQDIVNFAKNISLDISGYSMDYEKSKLNVNKKTDKDVNTESKNEEK